MNTTAIRVEKLSKKYPDLKEVLSQYLGTPADTGKQGASHQLSNNGIWTLGDPQNAKRSLGKKLVEERVNKAVAFIEAWKKHK